MEHKDNIIGLKFNRLTVVAYAPDYVSPTGKHWTNCLCRCDCGRMHTARACSLKSGDVKSCGCLNREKAGANLRKHGLSHRDPLYTVWKGMRERCTNPKQPHWHRYGGRGITICAEWNDFVVFRAWALEHGWRPRLTIDRIDNDRGYSPDNCRIVSFKENNDNRSNIRDSRGRYARLAI